MFRNQYDQDVSVWSPQGRIHQIEYAMEAVKQGSATVGVKTRDYAVLVALKRAPSELCAQFQKKIIQIDEHCGCSIAGLTADGRSLANYMRKICSEHRWAHSEAMPLLRVMTRVASKLQIPTQRYGARPFGVGVLVAGCDSQGPHIYYQCPSANYYDCRAIAIGARSQSARTYLEKQLDSLAAPEGLSLAALITHALQALNDTLPNEEGAALSARNCSLAVVGRDVPFRVYEDSEIDELLSSVTLTRLRDKYATGGGAATDTQTGGEAAGADLSTPPDAMDTTATTRGEEADTNTARDDEQQQQPPPQQ